MVREGCLSFSLVVFSMGMVMSQNLLSYDEGVIKELRRVYSCSIETILQSLTQPPNRYYVRVNILRVDSSWLAERLREIGFEVYVDEFIDEALWFPVEGPQELDLDGIDCRIVVDKFTAESVYIGANVYAPGVIDVKGSCKEGQRAVVVAPNNIAVAVGKLADDFENKLRVGRGLVVRVETSIYRVPSLRDTPYYVKGYIYEQALPSMYVARVLDPRPGSVIVDMCAAPGGKTSHIYELVGGKAKIYAFDHSRKKVERLRRELMRLGHKGVVVVRADSRYLDKDFPWLKADYVLLDPPCTALGVRPKLYDRKTRNDITSAVHYQRQFLRAAWNILKPGGVLVYSTCTLTMAENEDNIRYAVEELGFELEEAMPLRGSRGRWCRECQWFHPHVHGTPGHFIAKLYKPS